MPESRRTVVSLQYDRIFRRFRNRNVGPRAASTRSEPGVPARPEGFDVKALVTVSVSLDGTTHQLAHRQLPYFEEALARTSVVRPSGCMVR